MSRKFAVGNCETQHPIHQGGGFATFSSIEPVDVHYFPQMNSMGFSFSAQFADGSIRMYREDGLCPDALAYSLKRKPVTRPWLNMSEVPEKCLWMRRINTQALTVSSIGERGVWIGRDTNLGWGEPLRRYEYAPTCQGPWLPCTVVE